MNRRRKWGWWLAGGFVLAGVSGVMVAYLVTGFGEYDLPTTARQLGAHKAAAEKAGIWLKPPAGTGAMAYGDFREMAKKVRPLAKGVEVPAASLTTEEARKKRGAVAGDVLRALDLAAVESVEMDFVTGVYPEFGGLTAGVQILAFDAELAARVGDAETAIQRLRACRRLAELSGRRNVRIGQLVEYKLEDIANQAASRIAGSWSGQPELLAKLTKVFSTPLYEPDAATIARGEELNARLYWQNFAMEEWTDLDAFSATQDANDTPNFKVPKSMARDALMARHYEVHSRLIAAADKGWDEYAKEMRAVGQKAASSKTLTWRAYQGYSGVGNENRVFIKARRAAMLGGLAFLTKSPRRPVDPYAPGQAVRIAARPEGFVAYSVGFNRVDDGGQLKKDRQDVGYLFLVSAK